MIFTTSYTAALGAITLASDGENLVGLWIDGQKYFAETVAESIEDKSGLLIFARTKKWLDAYFAGEKPEICDLSLAPDGGEFRKNVWEMLCEIPYGQCTTYGEIAKKMASRMGKKSMSSQAVGGAVGHNPISIIIPCHRVVGSNGSLTGYAGGIDKKIKLLQLEGADISRFFIPKKSSAR